MTTTTKEFPVCLIAVNKGSQRCSHNNTKEDTTLKLNSTSQKISSGSLDEFSSQIGSSGVILDHQKGLVITSALSFSEFLHGERSLGNGHQLDDEDGYLNPISGGELSDLSVSVLIQNHKVERLGHQYCSKLLNLGSKVTSGMGVLQRERTFGVHNRTGLSGLWTKQGGHRGMKKGTEAPHQEILVFDASILLLWRCEALEDEMRRLLPKGDGWELDYGEKSGEIGSSSHHGEGQSRIHIDEGEESDARSGRSQRSFVSWFALLKVNGGLPVLNANTSIVPRSCLRMGQPVLVCGTPFATLGPSIFLNSLSSGIITKVTGRKSALVMTDARCMPGMEGGGILITDQNQRSLAAVIVSPLCWKSNEWIGLTLACSMEAILDSLHHLTSNDPRTRSLTSSEDIHSCHHETYSSKALASRVPSFESVVLLRVGTVWGSGVTVDASQGLIVTCRHVVKNASFGRVRVKAPFHPWMKATVVYMTSDLSPFDLAVVKVEELPVSHLLVDVEISPDCREGSKVYAVGYPLFEPSQSTGHSVTSGVVSKVVKVNQEPVMIQSSCAVHAGASGGGLLCARTGRLLGIIASNSRDADSGASFPHVNFSIPVDCFRQALDQFAQTKDVSCFQQLDGCDERIAKIWSLQENGSYRRVVRSKL